MENLKDKLKAARIELDAIQEQIKDGIKARLADHVGLKEALTKLESSNDLTTDNSGEFCTYVHFSAKTCIDVSDKLECEALEEYVMDYAAYIDLKQDVLLNFIGPAIVVDNYDNHSVYDMDANKELIKKNIKPLKVIKRAIEMYQNKRGEFNWVILVDRYGSPIKTL